VVGVKIAERLLLSERWIAVVGDYACIEPLIAVSRHPAVVLAAGGGAALALIKKTRGLLEAMDFLEEWRGVIILEVYRAADRRCRFEALKLAAESEEERRERLRAVLRELKEAIER
jgi:hypothetical protein